MSRPLFLLLVVADRNLARPNPKTLWQKLYHGTFTASKGLQIPEGGCVDVGGDARWAVVAGREFPRASAGKWWNTNCETLGSSLAFDLHLKVCSSSDSTLQTATEGNC